MRSRRPELLADRCPDCRLPSALCLCVDVPRVETRTRFLVLRHARQANKKSNTAHFAAMALAGATLVDYGDAGPRFDDAGLDAPGTVLLFPGGPTTPPEPRPARVVVVDGSWSQARRMVQRIPALRALPRLSLPGPAPGTRRLRRPPHPEGMSTLEAVAHAVALLEGEAAAAPLFALHAEHLRRVLVTRGRRAE
jgi:DTW domain-containing protein YfiP